MDRRTFLLVGTALASLPMTGTPGLSGAQSHAPVRLKASGRAATFGNQYIERVFKQDSWQTVRLRNNRTGSVYEFPDAHDVVLEFADIEDIHQSPVQAQKVALRDFAYGGKELRNKVGGGKELVFRGRWRGIDLSVSYELQLDWFYIKKRVEVTNQRSHPVFLCSLYLESLRNRLASEHMIDAVPRAKIITLGGAESPTMRYKHVQRNADSFNLMEYPGGIESLFDLKYFPGIFLRPGEAYVSYPAVVGMTQKDNVDFELRQYVYKEFYWYTGVAPHTYAPWLVHLNWDGTPENIYPHLRKSALMGCKLFIVDARSDRYRMEERGNEKWLEYELPDKTRFPDGTEGFLIETKTHGLKIGYYLRTAALVLRRREWMIDNPKLPESFKDNPPLRSGHYIGNQGDSCFGCEPYERYFLNYTMEHIKSYRSNHFHFDWYITYPCAQNNHDHLPNGWDAMDKQNEAFMRALIAMRAENPAITLQSGGGTHSVHWMKWLSHALYHDTHPGPIPDLSFTRSCGALARQRLHYYAGDGFVPMMMYSDWRDAGGDLTQNPFGWKDGFMNAIALAPQVRVEAGLYSYGQEELAWMKKWMDWRAAHTKGYANVRFLGGSPLERGTEGYAFIDNSQGYLYFVNNEYADHEVSVHLDESIGIFNRKLRYQVALLYPLDAPLTSGGNSYFEYGQELKLQLPFKTIRYLSVFAYAGNIQGNRSISHLPAQPDRWVISTRDISRKKSDRRIQYTCSLSIRAEGIAPKGPSEGPKDRTIRVLSGFVNENAEDRIYLLLYADPSARDMETNTNPFPGLRVSLNGEQIGGTLKIRNDRGEAQGQRALPFFFSNVTPFVKAGTNTIQWEAGSDMYRFVEAILVHETAETFPGLASSTERLRK